MSVLLDFFKKAFKDKKRMYILFFIGIIMLLLSNFFIRTKDNVNAENNSKKFNDINIEEQRLEKILSKIEGAGETKVMITYESGVEKIIVKNTKISKSVSGTNENINIKNTSEISEENQTVMNGSGSSQTPFVAKEIMPGIRGVLVVSEGADNEKVRIDLTNAVAAVFDVPYYRIQVLQKSK